MVVVLSVRNLQIFVGKLQLSSPPSTFLIHDAAVEFVGGGCATYCAFLHKDIVK